MNFESKFTKKKNYSLGKILMGNRWEISLRGGKSVGNFHSWWEIDGKFPSRWEISHQFPIKNFSHHVVFPSDSNHDTLTTLT